MKWFLFFGFVFWIEVAYLQPSDRVYSRAEYIQMYQDDAVKEMQRSGIPASITMAQALLESGDGNSPLAKYANNHFGIKCHDWKGPTFIQDDDARNECFRKYSDPYESYQDHTVFLQTRPRYASLFELKPTDYKGWAHGLKKAGYATNPKYPEMLIKIIEDFELHKLDIHQKLPEKPLPKPKPLKHIKERPREIEADTRYATQTHENGIPYIVANIGDTPELIARRLEMGPWEIRKYNDLAKNQSIQEGDIIFIKPKRAKSKSRALHTVKEGENLWSISQAYGIKLKKLAKMNGFRKDQALEVGKNITLQPR